VLGEAIVGAGAGYAGLAAGARRSFGPGCSGVAGALLTTESHVSSYERRHRASCRTDARDPPGGIPFGSLAHRTNTVLFRGSAVRRWSPCGALSGAGLSPPSPDRSAARADGVVRGSSWRRGAPDVRRGGSDTGGPRWIRQSLARRRGGLGRGSRAAARTRRGSRGRRAAAAHRFRRGRIVHAAHRYDSLRVRSRHGRGVAGLEGR